MDRSGTPWSGPSGRSRRESIHAGLPPTVWRAIACHESQVGGHANLRDLSDEERERVWEGQTFVRVFSTVNGGPTVETDLFEGIRR
jgi:hypothetical protein